MSARTTTAIEEAIATRSRVTVEYASAPGARLVEPHAIFVSETGKHCVHAIQLEGPTSGGRLPDWRQFDTSKIIAATVEGQHFEVSAEFKPNSPKYAHGLLASV